MLNSKILIAFAFLMLSEICLGEPAALAEKPDAADANAIELFDGKTLNGWTMLDGKPVTEGWVVRDGLLCRESRGGHLLSQQEFGDFDLEFEWKIAERGNSGIKYRLKQFGKQWLGCEYQLYDDRGKPGTVSSTGAIYALYAPPEDKPAKPVGEFNISRIVVRGPDVEHWLNGRKIIEAEIGSEDWKRRIAKSKFNQYPGFAETSKSKLMLQDHGSKIWFRKITLRPLDQKADGAKDEAEAAIDFDREIRPILANTCYTCHGPDENARQSSLRLDTRAGAFADLGGYHALVPGKPEESELIRRVQSQEESEKMPPPEAQQQLSAKQIDLIRRWVETGADWQEHWSLVPPQPLTPPLVKNSSWVKNPIDAFILSRLEREQLSPSNSAAKETLLRRVTLDLTGLPPTLSELDAFLADDSPDAYEKVVDRLLASPRYGEHMALGWLDAARYSDSNGYQQERTRTMWPWRDWVVRALNENMPYDQFTIEQLAGDLLPDPTADQLVATGFHRNHMLNGEGGRIAEESRVEYVVDRAETTGTVWLGLTAGCARCHDHKFDPISQKEFYSLYAFFNSIDETGSVDRGGNANPVLPLPTPEQQSRRRELQAERNELEQQLKEADEEQTKDLQKRLEQNRKQIDAVNGSILETMIMRERNEPRTTYLLNRGQWDQPDTSAEIPPGVPACFPPLPEEGPANRLALAKWLVSPEHPLTARVAVNRAWQQFFGTGLVKTTEDFGAQGERPSHPELLDWLARRFNHPQDGNWDLKSLHRLIVTSQTYRQSSHVTPRSLERDPDNRLLARGPRFRLSSLALRDQALSLSGLLVEKPGGPPVKPYQPAGVWLDLTLGKIKYEQDHGESLYRRSLYTFWRRSVGPTMFFDVSARQVCTVRLSRTNTPLHALTLMNDITYLEAARLLAQRVLRETGSAEDRLKRAFRLATSRHPTEEEHETLLSILQTVHAKFENDPGSAKQLLEVGEWPRDPSLIEIEAAGYTAVMNVILNLDEVLTKE
jgi:mono/diheme cytochrome c family protein